MADDVLAPHGDYDDPSSKTHIELSDAGGRYVDIMREQTPSGAPDSVPSHKIVSIYAHSVVADLCATRRLNPLSELPRLLPFVTDQYLGEKTSSCIHRVMQQASERLISVTQRSITSQLSSGCIRRKGQYGGLDFSTCPSSTFVH